MQAEESLGAQCTCSCYREIRSAPPSRLQPRGGGGGGGQSLSYFTPCYDTTNTAPALSLPPPVPSRSIPQPASSAFLRRLCARGGAAKSTSPQLQQLQSIRSMMNSVVSFLLPRSFLPPAVFPGLSLAPLLAWESPPRAKLPPAGSMTAACFARPPRYLDFKSSLYTSAGSHRLGFTVLLGAICYLLLISTLT